MSQLEAVFMQLLLVLPIYKGAAASLRGDEAALVLFQYIKVY